MASDRAYKGTIYATQELVKRERFIGVVYEAAKRDDGIIEVLLKNGNSCFHTSLGFLEYDCHYPNVITEPILPDAVDWAYRAMTVAYDKIAFLLPLRFIETAEAKGLFDKTPLSRIYVLTKPLPYRKGRCAWFIWQKGSYDPPVVRWV